MFMFTFRQTSLISLRFSSRLSERANLLVRNFHAVTYTSESYTGKLSPLIYRNCSLYTTSIKADSNVSQRGGSSTEDKEVSEAEQRSGKDKKVKVRSLTLRSNIAEHDLGIKVNQVNEWLAKKQEVKVTIVSKKSKSENLKKGSLKTVFDHIVQRSRDLSVVKLARHTDTDMLVILSPKSSTSSSSVAGARAESEGEPEATKQKPFTLKELRDTKDMESKKKKEIKVEDS